MCAGVCVNVQVHVCMCRCICVCVGAWCMCRCMYVRSCHVFLPFGHAKYSQYPYFVTADRVEDVADSLPKWSTLPHGDIAEENSGELLQTSSQAQSLANNRLSINPVNALANNRLQSLANNQMPISSVNNNIRLSIRPVNGQQPNTVNGQQTNTHNPSH